MFRKQRMWMAASFVLLSTSVVALAPGAAQASTDGSGRTEAITWQMQVLAPTTSGSGRSYAYLADMIDKNTGGQVKLRVAYSLGLGLPLGSMVSLTQRRAVDVGDLIGSQVEPTWPELSLPELPGLIPYSVANRRRVLKALRPYFEQQAQKFNQIYMASCQADPRAIISRAPLHSLSDLKGLKVRFAGATESKLTTALGANPVSVVAPELYTALQTGVVDAAWAPASYFYQSKFYEVAKYLLNANLGGAIQHETVNLDAWNELSASQKTGVRKSFNQFAETCLQNVDEDFSSASADFRKVGVTVTDLSAGDQKTISQLTAPLVGAWAATHGPDAAKMVYTVRNALGSRAVTSTLRASLQVPKPTKVTARAKGTFTAELVPAEFGGILKWQLAYSGLTGPVTAARLRIGRPGKAGPVVVTLCSKGCKSGLSGTVNLIKNGYRQLVYGRVYITLETALNPKGEIRGQLTSKKVS